MPRRRLLLYTEQNIRQHAPITHGVLEAIRERHGWEVRLGDAASPGELARVRAWQTDGIIAYGWPSHRIRRFKRAVRAVVNIAFRDPQAADATLFVDLYRGGRQAAEFFLQRGFHAFACLTARRGGGVMAERLRGFRDVLTEAGRDCEVFEQELGSESVWREPQADMVAWLRTLPPQSALFATGVWVGRDALEACRQAGIAVPERLAVLCANDDPVLCETIEPPLAAVPMPWQAVGRRAVELVAERLRGRPPRKRLVRVQSQPVIVRRSADILAVRHGDLRRALELIAEHACDPIDVPALCRASGIGRRSLERLFARELERSPKQEIDRVRFSRAEALLRDPAMSVGAVARRCGFDAEVFSRRFAARYGCAPGQWRRQLP